jgi:hypothetical protein
MKDKTKILNISESFNLTRKALKENQKQLKQLTTAGVFKYDPFKLY